MSVVGRRNTGEGEREEENGFHWSRKAAGFGSAFHMLLRQERG